MLGTLTKFLREPAIYEILRLRGLEALETEGVYLYTPKLQKDMKFVAHDATIGHDFVSNKSLYVEALQDVITRSSPVSVSELQITTADGLLGHLTDEASME